MSNKTTYDLQMEENARAITVHIKAHFKGNTDLFHYAAQQMDADWPFAKAAYDVCVACGGAIYDRPLLGPTDLMLLGRQFGCEVKIASFAKEQTCKARKTSLGM